MKRILALPALLVALTAVASAAPSKVQLEIWGVEATDEVSIDGAAQTPKGGGGRIFLGDPTATNAPVLVEVTSGKHEITVRRGECAPRSFVVSVEGSTKRAIVFEKEDPERCAIPLLPARR
ncbi:MAG: hypothetical protein ACXWUG_17670 [Polyangiales bacterium]